MAPRETLKQQNIKLYEIANLLNYEIGNEGDRATRDALFAASQAVQIALLHLREVAYRRIEAGEQSDS